ncbi:MAG: hypothetical protein ACREJB_04825 [Planctomycetaceae bacterium]
MNLIRSLFLGSCLVLLIVAMLAAEQNGGGQPARTPKEALAEFNDLIGPWRGVGQPKRGSNQGAWAETAEWIWDFSGDEAAIHYDVADGKLLQSARLTWDPKSRNFQLTATLPDDATRTYTGRLDEKRNLVLESPVDDEGQVHRVTITRLNEKRSLVLFETRGERQSFYRRVAQVGYTREGQSLAIEGANGPECVVTGGLGTIPVSYKGQTYYVCCTGCQQAFEDDPEGILAEYRAKQAEKKR